MCVEAGFYPARCMRRVAIYRCGGDPCGRSERLPAPTALASSERGLASASETGGGSERSSGPPCGPVFPRRPQAAEPPRGGDGEAPGGQAQRRSSRSARWGTPRPRPEDGRPPHPPTGSDNHRTTPRDAAATDPPKPNQGGGGPRSAAHRRHCGAWNRAASPWAPTTTSIPGSWPT